MPDATSLHHFLQNHHQYCIALNINRPVVNLAEAGLFIFVFLFFVCLFFVVLFLFTNHSLTCSYTTGRKLYKAACRYTY